MMCVSVIFTRRVSGIAKYEKEALVLSGGYLKQTHRHKSYVGGEIASRSRGLMFRRRHAEADVFGVSQGC